MQLKHKTLNSMILIVAVFLTPICMATDKEDIDFNNLLEEAKTGYIPSIERVIEAYEKGIGTEQDSQEANYWKRKLTVIRTTSSEESLHQGHHANELANIEYFPLLNIGLKKLNDGDYFVRNPILEATFVPSGLTVGAIIDIVISPFTSTKHAYHQYNLAYRPSKFENPNSMIAQAYHADLD